MTESASSSRQNRRRGRGLHTLVEAILNAAIASEKHPVPREAIVTRHNSRVMKVPPSRSVAVSSRGLRIVATAAGLRRKP